MAADKHWNKIPNSRHRNDPRPIWRQSGLSFVNETYPTFSGPPLMENCDTLLKSLALQEGRGENTLL